MQVYFLFVHKYLLLMGLTSLGLAVAMTGIDL